MREENLVGYDIQEKQPFTANHQSELASSGAYFFKSAEFFENYAEQSIAAGLHVDGEYYVSMVYKPMFNEGCRIFVYELNHFMQWETPNDLENYIYWSGALRRLNKKRRQSKNLGFWSNRCNSRSARTQSRGVRSGPTNLHSRISGLPAPT